MGVRPEAMADQASARFQTSDNQLPMHVTLIQPLGDKMDVYLKTERHRHSIAHVDAHAGIRVGETISVFIDTSRVHFFASTEPGERIANNHTQNVFGSGRQPLPAAT